MTESKTVKEDGEFYGQLFFNKERKYSYLHFLGSGVEFCDIFSHQLEFFYSRYIRLREIDNPRCSLLPDEFWMKILKSDLEALVPLIEKLIVYHSHNSQNCSNYYHKIGEKLGMSKEQVEEKVWGDAK